MPVRGIAHLNSIGSVDTSFVSQGSFYDYSLADTRSSNAALGADGSLVLLGPFRLANDTWPYAVNRLIEYGPPLLNALGFIPSLVSDYQPASSKGRFIASKLRPISPNGLISGLSQARPVPWLLRMLTPSFSCADFTV